MYDEIVRKIYDEVSEQGTYIIAEDCGGYVKVGKTGEIGQRIKELQVGNPRHLYVIFWIPHTDIEKELEVIFKPLYVKGSWYHHDPEIDEFIREFEAEVENVGQIKERPNLPIIVARR
jgi:hypothetical protein